MKNEIAEEFIRESAYQFKDSFKRLFHCLGQLNDEQIWWRPDDKMNSAGILIKHVCGNIRQWTITAINNTEDRRNRPQEFINDPATSKSDLISLAKSLEADFLDAISRLDTSRLTELRTIQGYEVTLLGAIFHALTHLEGHTGQIVFLTRIQLGDNYKILFIPQTEEQRSAWKPDS